MWLSNITRNPYPFPKRWYVQGRARTNSEADVLSAESVKKTLSTQQSSPTGGQRVSPARDQALWIHAPVTCSRSGPRMVKVLEVFEESGDGEGRLLWSAIVIDAGRFPWKTECPGLGHPVG